MMEGARRRTWRSRGSYSEGAVMGMFDEIRCDVPLPDEGPTQAVLFQTKSFPNPGLQRYLITQAGRLLDAFGRDLEPDGYITFYTSTLDETSTSQVWREYRARFSDGQLLNIVCVEEGSAQVRYYGLASFRHYLAPASVIEPKDKSEMNPNGEIGTEQS